MYLDDRNCAACNSIAVRVPKATVNLSPALNASVILIEKGIAMIPKMEDQPSKTGQGKQGTASLAAILLFTIAAWGGGPRQQAGRHASSSSAQDVELAIAAPDELSTALTELGRRFEQKSGNHISFTFTDSANLIQQIRTGTNLDAVFLSDMKEARRLASSGTLKSSSIQEYGRDQMVLCIGPGVHIEPRPGNPLLLLASRNIHHIAIANPQYTAFGKATMQALEAVHIYDYDLELRVKFLIGNNIAEAAHFLEHGDAAVALLPGTAIKAYQFDNNTRVLLIPSKLYRPIRKGAGVLRRSQHPAQALEFLKFAVSREGRAILEDAGLDEPHRAIAGKHLSKR